MIWINNFPLPHSVNKSLMPIVSKAGINKKTGRPYFKGRMIKTKDANQYVMRCLQWKNANLDAVNRLRKEIFDLKKKVESSGRVFALQVDTYFVFHVERIFTVNGKTEPLDVDNRIKPCWDAIKTILSIDDKAFFAGHCEKITAPTKDLECVMIRLTLITPRTVEQIQRQMRADTSSLE